MSVFPDERCRCPLRKNAAHCIQRQSWTPQPRECRVCDFYGRKEANGTKPASGDTKPAANDTKPVPRETFQPKKEEGNVSFKEKILARVEREKVVGKSRFMQCDSIPKGEVLPTAQELEKEGKVKVWPGQREGSFKVTLPGHGDPRTGGERKASPAKPKPEKKVSAPAALGSSPPKNGGGRTGSAGDVFSAAIAELKQQREKIDRAIEALEGMTT